MRELSLPEVELPAHVAALGMRFHTGAKLPDGSLLISVDRAGIYRITYGR